MLLSTKIQIPTTSEPQIKNLFDNLKTSKFHCSTMASKNKSLILMRQLKIAFKVVYISNINSTSLGLIKIS